MWLNTNSTGTANAAANGSKTVADPLAEYDTMRPLWQRARAVCGGERFVKATDRVVDRVAFRNMLIPFSPSMTNRQYEFYKAEAELPGICAQFVKMIVGGLLRKQPTLELPEDIPDEQKAEIHDWIINQFGQDGSSMASFLDNALMEELPGKAWVYVDYPSFKEDEFEALTPEERAKVKPYPVLWQAESVINWRTSTDKFGRCVLTRVIVRGLKEEYSDDEGSQDEFHARMVDTIWVHELDKSNNYQIRVFQEKSNTTQVPVVQGKRLKNQSPGKDFELKELITDILVDGERLTCIPAWPLNGSIELSEPIMSTIVDKEISLYNKISRRNHLLYGAATYTPIITADITDDQFQKIVDQGLGGWIKLPSDGKADVLKTPTEALADYDRTIAASIEEMAKLGIRMLTPEVDQSGVALEIRNAAQTAQLGTLNNKTSNTLRQVICFMIRWRYPKLELRPEQIKFSLSSDFNPIPLGADWLRLATEWYEKGLIPRSAWLLILKTNDMLDPGYDDDEGQEEIEEGMERLLHKQNEAYASQIEAAGSLAPAGPGGKPSVKPKLQQVK